MRTLKSLNRFTPTRAQLMSGALILSAGALAYAVPNVFTAGTNVSAAQMNANFADVEARIAALETKLANVSLETVNSQPTVRFSGVNVQVVNGQGSTATANGTGNLIVGYDETYRGTLTRCTIGTNPNTSAIVTDQATCGEAGGTWTTAGFKTGSHYLVLGSENNYSRWGGMVAGVRNFSNYDFASASGGTSNTASGGYASVSGGIDNTASGGWASVSGGTRNTASGRYASVSGGFNNTASGFRASVSGGASNTASGNSASVSGGLGCDVSALYGWDVGAPTSGCSPNVGQ